MARPRTITPSPEELIELGKDLLAWATEETPELRCRFCQWYSLKGFYCEGAMRYAHSWSRSLQWCASITA